MLIVCPACQAEYNVPDALLGRAPRQVRCARCAHAWLPDELRPPEPELPAPPPTPPPATPVAEPASLASEPEHDAEPVTAPSLAEEARLPTTAGAGHTRRGGVGPALGWLVSLMLLGAAGWATATWRDAVMQAWPASQRLYQWIGLG